MKKFKLTSTNSAIANIPKDIILWNYWDHEHIVGTHSKHYKKIKILFEDEKCCYSERKAKLPYLPFYITETSLVVMEDDFTMRVWHNTLFDFVKAEQLLKFEELGKEKTKVTKTDFMEVPMILKFLQPFFDKMMKKWFIDVWDEDVPMRERRYKVCKLGFKDFHGINYINDKEVSNEERDPHVPYKFKLPVPKVTNIKKEGSFRKIKSI
jgi:hypothetical protein|tara:strand:- start:536 stop:1162 length:627 start_codon:yes stop_codon:yes gene_type:complete